MPLDENIFSVGDASEERRDEMRYEDFVSRFVHDVIRRGEWELVVDELEPLNSNLFEFPLFNEDFCTWIIVEAERQSHWIHNRHQNYPAVDFELSAMGWVGEHYTRVLQDYVAPIAKKIWGLEGDWVDKPYCENFMIRYRPEDQSSLYLHHDFSHYTVGVRLNGEFEGGGTYFQRLGKTLTPVRNGNAFLHPGMITHRHGARPIFSGKRYILVSFVRAGQNSL
jgi:hypothetical protein